MSTTNMIVSGVVGAIGHRWLLSQHNYEGENLNKTDVLIIGLAGGFAGGLVSNWIMPGHGMFTAVAAGIAGYIAFDYFLFGN